MTDLEFINEHGYLVIRDLFDDAEIAILIEKYNQTNFQKDHLTQYDQWAGSHPEDILEFLRDSKFLSVISNLTDCKLMWAQMQGFRLKSGSEARRLNWHFGRESYLYLMPQFAGWTLWIPLDPIDTADQCGGMAFLSRSLMDGGGEARMLSKLAERDDYMELSKSFSDLSRNFIDNPLLDTLRDEPNFDVGDAVLLHKFTYHTSVMLKKGKLNRRRAFAFRFVDEKGELNKYGVEKFGPHLSNKKMSSEVAKYDHRTPLKEITHMFKTIF